MGDAEHGRFGDLACCGQHPLQLRRTDALSRNLDGVVGAAEDVIETIVPPHREIAVHPDSGDRIPIAVEIALVSLPEALGETDGRMAEDELADFAVRHAVSGEVDDVSAGPER